MVYFNKSLHWVWRAFILFCIYILPQYVYVLCHVKWFIHYFVCILYGRAWTMFRPKMSWVQCWQEWVLHCKYNVLYMTDTCIFTTVFILWKHLPYVAMPPKAIVSVLGMLSVLYSPMALTSQYYLKICACQERNAFTELFIFCYIGMVVQWMYCSFRKLLQGICNLHLFLQVQIIQMSRKSHHPPSVIMRLQGQEIWMYSE